MKMALLVAPVVFLLGILLGNLLWEGSESEPSAPLPAATGSTLTDMRRVDRDLPSEPIETQDQETERLPLEKETDELFSEALLQFFHEEFSKAWTEQRPEKPNEEELALGEERFRQVVLIIPSQLANVSVEEKTNAETLTTALTQGHGLDWIELAQDREYTPDPKDIEWAAIDNCCAKRVIGEEVDGAEFASDKEAPFTEGMTIQFGPGVHYLDSKRFKIPSGSSFPSDITIKGAGMNATLLRLGNIDPREDIDRFSFEDITIDANNFGFFYIYGHNLVLDLNRVRFVRFDGGHGACVLFHSSGCLIRAQDCLFIGGYGKASIPGSGELFSGESMLARFRNCRFEFLDLTLDCADHSGRFSFQDCTFALLKENPLLEPIQNVDFVSCRVESLLEPDTNPEDLKKDLSDLFWQLK